jgi:hypothetical protein
MLWFAKGLKLEELAAKQLTLDDFKVLMQAYQINYDHERNIVLKTSGQTYSWNLDDSHVGLLFLLFTKGAENAGLGRLPTRIIECGQTAT